MIFVVIIKVATVDPHEYPNGNAFIAELHGGPDKNTTSSMKVNVSDDEENVEVILEKLEPTSKYHCELFIPVTASVHVQGQDAVSVKNIFGSELVVYAKRFINIKEVRANKIVLQSEEDNISCMGLLLGEKTCVETKKNGASNNFQKRKF